MKFSYGTYSNTYWDKETNIVTKNFIKRIGKNIDDEFTREVQAFMKLKKCNLVPELYDVNYDNYSIKMSYAGECIGSFINNKISKRSKKVKNFLKNLPENYEELLDNVVEEMHRRGVYHKDLHKDNICFDGEKFIAIDFNLTEIYDNQSENHIDDMKVKLNKVKKEIDHCFKLNNGYSEFDLIPPYIKILLLLFLFFIIILIPLKIIKL